MCVSVYALFSFLLSLFRFFSFILLLLPLLLLLVVVLSSIFIELACIVLVWCGIMIYLCNTSNKYMRKHSDTFHQYNTHTQTNERTNAHNSEWNNNKKSTLTATHTQSLTFFWSCSALFHHSLIHSLSLSRSILHTINSYLCVPRQTMITNTSERTNE